MKEEKSTLPKKFGQRNIVSRRSNKSDSRKFQGKPLLSIDIGQHTTKLVLGRSVKPTVVEVKRAVSFQTPRGSVEKGRILDLSALSKQISNVIGTEKLSAAYVFCTMENAEIITREITLPTKNEAVMGNMLQFEVQQYMPVDLENYIIQSKMLDSFDDNGTDKTRFLSTAVPKDLAQSYFDLLQKANLKAAVLDIQSNCADKLVLSEIAAASDSVIPAEGPFAVIDFGYSHINAILMEDGRYQFNRYIDQGAANIDRSLMSVFEYTEEEIERRKRTDIDLSTSLSISAAAPQDTNQAVLREVNIVKNIIDNWADELERVFKYYTSRSGGKTVQKILIHGGTVQIRGVGGYLSKVLGIPVEQVQKLNCVQIQDSSLQNIAPYLNAIGAFMRR